MRSAAFALAGIFLFSSLSFSAPPPAAPTGPTITIQVNDKATGDPIAQANVHAGNEQAKTDDYGQCSLVVQERGRYFDITVTKPGYVAMGADWRNLQPKQKLPEQLTFNMEPGTGMGGKVVDETGNPVSGAMVELIAPEMGGHKEGVVQSELRAEAKTNDAGVWSINTAPADVAMVDYQVRAAGYYTDQVYRNFPSVADLRNRTATLTVQHAASITGKVFDSTGKPVANADVMAGEEGWGGVRHRAHTNDAGEFTLSNLRPGMVSFAVMADNYAPQLVSAVAPATQPAEVHLSPGMPMKFHVVDQAGKPLAGVVISVDQWRNASYVDHTLRTNVDGNATWNGAPADEVEMSFTKRRYGSIVQRPITATTQPIQITLGPKTQVTGTVTDAATGAAITNFTVTPGIGWRNSDQVQWVSESEGWGGTAKISGDGHFTYEPTQPYPQYELRVQAPGYLPSDSKPFDNDAGDLALQFKLVKGVGIAGIVYGADHKPLPDATVHIVLGNRPLQLQSHGIVADWGHTVAPVQTDAQGHFGFAPEADAFALVCVTPDGYARLNAPSLHPSKQPPGIRGYAPYPTTRPSSYDLTLQPWATVQGKLMVGSKPGAHVELGLQIINSNWDGHQPQVYLDYMITTSADGQFKFDHVPPGKVQVAKIIRTGDSQGISAAVMVDAKPGETATVNMGGTGRPVVGKFDIPSSFPHGNWIAWNASLHPHMASLKGPDMPLAIRIGSAEARRKWIEQWAQTDEGKAFVAAQKKQMENMGQTNFQFAVQPDGTFRVDDVPAGTYEIFTQFFPANIMNGGGDWNHPLGVSRKQIVVPAMPTGRSDEPLDVGTIAVTPPQQQPMQ